MSRIFYGVENKYNDITDVCYCLALDSQYIDIPSNEHDRAKLYGDPAVNVFKHILLVLENGDHKRFDAGMMLRMEKKNIVCNMLQTNRPRVNFTIVDPVQRLHDVQSRMSCFSGKMSEEVSEQLMSVMFIKPHESVLELGSNIGRNTLVIGSILDDETRLVTLETDPQTVKKLAINKALNCMKFNIECAALTAKKLIQRETDWNTIQSETVLPGYFAVNSVTLDYLHNKYGFQFDVLVADCEGALFYILQEFPEILQGTIKTLILENDYINIEHKQYVDKCFTANNFHRVYSHGNGWGPCADYFWEVWQK